MMTNPDPVASSGALAHDMTDREPIRAPSLALWVEDASYIDPIMDAWGRNVASRLVDGLEAEFCAAARFATAIWSAIRNLRACGSHRDPGSEKRSPLVDARR